MPATTITLDQVELWLQGIAKGVIVLDRDNEAMARAALGYLGAPAPAPAPTPEPLPPGYITPHFTLEEFTRSDTAQANGIDNSPDVEETTRIQELAEAMEEVRAICGNHPVYISSGYRCPALNALVGGASNSAHLYGCACDFTIPDFGSVLDVCRALESHLVEVGVDQLIDESGGGAEWVHLGLAIPPSTTPRHQCLTIDSNGTRTGFA